MTFKFGLLVLLFAFGANFAVEQKPSLPGVDGVPYVQQLNPLSISLLRMYRSEVQSSLSTRFSNSIDSSKATCAWDGEREECSLSISGMKYLVKRSKTELSKVLIERLTCVEKTNKPSCEEEKACFWDFGYEECLYTDLRRGHKDSPCAKAAPRYFDYFQAATVCPRQDPGESCESKRYCKWSVYGYCHVDYGSVFYGIRSFQDKYHEIEDSVQAALKAQYTALQSADNFTWQSLLDFRPSIKCPSNIEQLVCEYAVVYWSNVMAPPLYCHGKYESAASDCKADALCKWTAGECMDDEDLAHSAAHRASRRVLSDSMPDGTDKKLTEAMDSCTFDRKTFKCSENCYFDHRDWVCRLRKEQLAALLTEHSKNSTDALCTYLRVDGFSQCYTRVSERYTTRIERQCKKSKLCRWDYDECVPIEEFYLSAAAEEDFRLKRRYYKFKKGCASHTTKKACSKSDKV